MRAGQFDHAHRMTRFAKAGDDAAVVFVAAGHRVERRRHDQAEVAHARYPDGVGARTRTTDTAAFSPTNSADSSGQEWAGGHISAETQRNCIARCTVA